jgi:diphthamide biosynthesis protein 2
MSSSENGHWHVQHLQFDDGSRNLKEQPCRLHTYELLTKLGRDPSIPIFDFYEIRRIVTEINDLVSKKSQNADFYSARVAIQFPDELLVDSPDVCWQFESLLPNSLIFCLGDSTYAPCCPDIPGAAHLGADCIVHYGHACFNPCDEIPVIYSFGGRLSSTYDKEWYASLTDDTIEQITTSIHSIDSVLLLYDAQYCHMIDDLSHHLSKRSGVAVISANLATQQPATVLPKFRKKSTHISEEVISNLRKIESSLQEPYQRDSFSLSGLTIPYDVDFSNYAIIFIGDDKSQLFLQIAMRLLSSPDKVPKQCYTWTPTILLHNKNHKFPPARRLDLSSSFQRKLNRRFYLLQRAKECSVFGILVSNTSDLCVQSIVRSIRQIVEYEGCDSDSGNRTSRTTYTFVVGKINVAKLSNFSEIDCFILVACPEQSLLEDEKEYAVPIITPLELCFALGLAEWGTVDYSLEGQDFMDLYDKHMNGHSTGKEYYDHDEPYFSLISGNLQSNVRKHSSEISDRDTKELLNADFNHNLAIYESAATDRLKEREYQGLQNKQQTVNGPLIHQVAEIGQKGIASNYDCR